MNSWCESCARKNCCYTTEIRPRCYLPTTNTAHGTPETYLAKSLRYSRDSHEIAEQTEPQTDLVNDSQVLAKDLVDDEFNPYDEECMRCKHLKLKCEFIPTYCKFESRDEPQTSGFVWTEDAIKNEPKSYTTWASTDETQTERNDR